MREKLKMMTGFSLVMGVAFAATIPLHANAATQEKKVQHEELVKKALESQAIESEMNQTGNEQLLSKKEVSDEDGQKEEVPLTNYKQVTLKKAMAIYKPNQLTVPVGTLHASTVSYAVKRATNKAYYEIVVGQNRYWVKETTNLIGTNSSPKPVVKSIKTTLQTNSAFTIYSKPTTTAPVLLRGKTSLKIVSVDAVKGFYVVDLGSRKGYMPFRHLKTSVSANHKVELVASTKLYEKVSGKNKLLGTLKRGTVIRITSSNASTVTFKSGKRQFSLERAAVIPTTKKESFTKLGKATYPVKLQAKTAATLYATDKTAVGSMPKNKQVELISLQGNYGVIEYAGKNMYVKLNQFKHTNMVDPTKNISPSRYSYYVRVINQLYPDFTKLEKIGQSVEGRAIYALKVGNGKKEILMDASLHAREHMTTNVLMEMIDQYTVSYRSNATFSGYKTRTVLNKTAIWFVPMMNPDGVTLVQSGLKSMTAKNQKIIKAYNKSSNYKRWKANGRGVDLNRNFDGIWKLQGKTAKSFMNYKGPSAFSEPESKALKAFVERHKFKTNYSYHSSGQVIYWYNFQNKKNYARDLNLTKKVSKITGYSIINPINRRGSGSSADWFILSQKQPGLTMEIAPYSGTGPVPHKYWSSIWNKNKSIGLFGANEASKR